MKILLFILIFISFDQQSPREPLFIDKLFIVVSERKSDEPYISYHERKDLDYFYTITFNIPSLKVSLFHIPERVNHFNYAHEEIEVTQSELLQSKVLYADELTYTDWSELQKCQEKVKVYFIYQEDYLSKDRFVLDHKFKALEAYVSTSGPE
ncbi:hypothetical protein [Algoriphagus aquimarinus]|uniref:hypothetical protein n=1 Tax=Algoriphagus aquimarinus TaxID=237018 RepID=UPI0030D7BE58|tara:strand:+ start:793 stop:1248 length:456 start_codon:yes stop_codon:yes gene_type:complete